MEKGQLSNEWAQEHNEQYLHDDWADSLGVFIENPEYVNTFEIDDAVKMYEEKEAFQFLHCWKMLRNEPKWNDKVLELNNTPTRKTQQPQGPCNPIGTQPSNENATIARLEGRDSAKNEEVLQQMQERNEKTEEKQEQQMQEILTLKGNKMRLIEKMFDLQKHEMEVRSKLKEEQLSLTKQDIEARAKQSEAQLLTTELGIMGADLDKLSPSIDDAVKMYEEKEAFQFLHCWKMLRNEPKWNDKVLELNNTPTRKTQQPQGPCNPIGTQPSNENATIARPEGRDSAKKRSKCKRGMKKTEEKQEQQMQEILTLKGNKMRLIEKMFDLQKHEMEVRSKLKEEQLSLTKQDIEARAKQSEAQLLTTELGIMGADLDKLSPSVRAYYSAMQQQIMERRGIITPHDSNGA
ncbi:hypothetical protein ZEAMMB73_Zm00001d028772 [Zea mays]|uniref:No apical meristem-associated C-terminal domain-containing protein n=2 Tax=Zea mays TaxID=4577 RepID=A0A1D6JZK6_MAIZE|nr:hypothetical protein ZEAMMB73_Zm00001d028772 [Zea mays]